MWQTLPDSQCELGESPFWHPHEASLYWLDIPGREVLRTRGPIDDPTIERWRLPQEPGCIAPARRGGFVIALRDGIYRARTWGGELVLLVRAAHDVATMRFNDGKCDAQGRLWVGTIQEPRDHAIAALFCLDARPGRSSNAQLALARMAEGATIANGLAFSVDGRRVLWADTPAHVVRAFDWLSERNILSGARVFAQFAMKPVDWSQDNRASYAGRPDGATLDAEGHYWCAMVEGAQLLRLSPSGTPSDSLPLPVMAPTMPCFGGDDLRTLFVTTARHGRPSEEIAQRPQSGQVIYRRVPFAGRTVDFFED